MDLIPLSERPADWDRQISAFDSKSLFQESAWVDFVLASYPRARADYYMFKQGGLLKGFFCAIRMKRAIFSLYESPLAGRGMFFGPVVDRAVDQVALITALVESCHLRGIASLELCGDWYSPPLMTQFGFKAYPRVSHVCPLDGGIDAVWAGMKGTCRTRIRKAEKSGLVAEVTDCRTIADHFYRIFESVRAQKGFKPSYGPEEPRLLLDQLLPRDRVFPVWVKLEGVVVGAALYPHDDRVLYYWDGASEPDLLSTSPNELLHWTAIKAAVSRGILAFDIGGDPLPSRFTTKFGGETRRDTIYRKTFHLLLPSARLIYQWARAASSQPALRLGT